MYSGDEIDIRQRSGYDNRGRFLSDSLFKERQLISHTLRSALDCPSGQGRCFNRFLNVGEQNRAGILTTLGQQIPNS
jgi:hypothetical protein